TRGGIIRGLGMTAIGQDSLKTRRTLTVGGRAYDYFSIPEAARSIGDVARLLMQDFTGGPAVVDLAAMRDGIVRLGGDPQKVNPLVPVDLVIDHSVMVDFSATKDAEQKNVNVEFE